MTATVTAVEVEGTVTGKTTAATAVATTTLLGSTAMRLRVMTVTVASVAAIVVEAATATTGHLVGHHRRLAATVVMEALRVMRPRRVTTRNAAATIRSRDEVG